MKNILVLGAGLVARPLIRYLLDQPDFQVTVATRTSSKADALVGSNVNGKAVALDINNDEALKELIKKTDLSISLLPYMHHVKVAKLCIEYKKHMVTTSYTSEDMRKLDADAKSAGIIILNEIGLDPGIDHMSAMKIIHHVQNQGGQIASFYSYCGGLPAPEANTNPFGYKFSWSPKGVVLAAKNNARYLKDGKIVSIPGENLFENYRLIEIEGIGRLESYPNRDSIPYIHTYGIDNVKSMFRGTLRNLGWCQLWKKIVDLGLLDEKEVILDGFDYKKFMAALVDSASGNVKRDAAKFLNISEDSEVIKKIQWLGLFDEVKIPADCKSPIDVIVDLLLSKLKYENKERDMIVLHHDFIYIKDDKNEKVTSTLIDFGKPNGASAMSRTVGLPAAIGARLILEGKIKASGVHIPVIPEIYEPVLGELERQGVFFKEKIHVS